MTTLTKAQQEALKRLWTRNPQGKTYLQFRRTVQAGFGFDQVVFVMWCGMLIGIEADGYTHS